MSSVLLCDGDGTHGNKKPPFDCPRVFKASWWMFAPYACRHENTSLLHSLVKDVVSSCCTNKTHVKFSRRWANMFDMVASDDDDDTFKFPYSISVFDRQIREPTSGQTILPGLLSPGSFYLIKEDNEYELMEILKGAWPLFVIIVSGSLLAGAIIWVLDRHKNADHFSESFKTGFFEGVWWAVVSMTTVGYGDKTPTSFLARLFGILWILFGVCLMSVFISVISAALTTKKNEVDNIIFKKVGVINGTYDYVIALGDSADIFLCENRGCLKRKLLDENHPLDGILLDQYAAVYKHNLDENDKKSVRREEFLEDMEVAWKSNLPVNHGILVTGVDQSLLHCFSDAANKMSLKTFDRLRHLMTAGKRKMSKLKAGVIASEYLTNGDDFTFWIGTGVSFASVIVICLIMALVDYLINRNKSAVSIHA